VSKSPAASAGLIGVPRTRTPWFTPQLCQFHGAFPTACETTAYLRSRRRVVPPLGGRSFAGAHPSLRLGKLLERVNSGSTDPQEISALPTFAEDSHRLATAKKRKPDHMYQSAL
jgi:hypothetical protein